MRLWLEPAAAFLKRLDLLLPGEFAAVDWAEVRERRRHVMRSEPSTNGGLIEWEPDPAEDLPDSG
jgi:hypothetical protein